MKLMTVLILISVEECDCHKKDNQMNIHYIYVYCGRALEGQAFVNGIGS